MKSIILSCFIVALILVGCVSVNSVMLSNEAYPPLTPEDVTIYLSEDDIPGEFERIAIINAEGDADWTNQSQLYEAVRKEAAKLGANGVLHTQLDEPSSGARVAGAVLGTGTTRRGEMVAIFVNYE